ncbi:MarR family winged helix-turn-helix transcriptional regulator [Frigidibacter sp. RF13]|uniref:MarR family winged helix-turn-helix transcriptional regulator n=1 Tax=Frigidibacter sp. RF13 TaxID=2997340 RepID=UPI002270038F|nr:MarR family winged helix-turn-helix transcriptional regulator [Frigidibacter sp. RF13]MCY1126503.1 MarR family winged helix-turn-helix transcriptional regulator [Frigidibacter sp. RF13]
MRRPPKFNLNEFLPYRLTVAAERLSVDFSRNYAKTFGLTIAEWRVLVHLTQTGEISVRDVEKRVGLEKSKVSRAASRLETAGYLTKSVNMDDRRLVKLALTEKGWELMADLIPVAIAHQDRLLSRLGDKLEAFMTTLTLIEDEDI